MAPQRRSRFFHVVPAVAMAMGLAWLAFAQGPERAQATPPWDPPNPPPAKPQERAVAAGLYWLAKHQMPTGNWSFEKYTQMCKDDTCAGIVSEESLSEATALGLLPLLAAGQTQAGKGPFQRTISAGIKWLTSHQKPNGDLSAGAEAQMRSHGLATIVLCEDFGMTHDKAIGAAA